VWEYGLANVASTGASTLCARLLPPFEGILTNNKQLFGTGSGAIYLLPGEGLPDVYLAFPSFGSGVSFPYGYPVEPDEPV